MKRLLIAFLIVWVASSAFAQRKQNYAACMSAAKRILGARVRVIKLGDLTGRGVVECVAVVPYDAQKGREILIRRGVVLELRGNRSRSLLTINGQAQNERGYVGLDFLDMSYTRGFALTMANVRSNGTRGFTMYLAYLDPQLRPEGMAMQISWNPKAHRFQEYAPNELDPPDFKPEVTNPPIPKR